MDEPHEDETAAPLEGDDALEDDDPDAPEIPFEGTGNDVEGEGDDDAEATSPPPPGPSEAQLEKAFKSLEGRAKRYTEGVTELASEAGIPLVPCALCTSVAPGFIINPEVEPLTEFQTVAVRALLGMDTGPKLVQAADAHACEACEGWGLVLTGSKVTGEREAKCRACGGKGYIGPPRELSPAEVAALPNHAYETVAPVDEPPADVDAWNTPRGHPEFGIAPQYRDPGWQERIAAWNAGEPAPLIEAVG